MHVRTEVENSEKRTGPPGQGDDLQPLARHRGCVCVCGEEVERMFRCLFFNQSLEVMFWQLKGETKERKIGR